MKILIIGCNGQLGSDMCEACKGAGYEVRGVDYPDIDITNEKSVSGIMSSMHPEIIINCSGFTAVDTAETEKAKAFAVNADGVSNIAKAALSYNASVVHYSTDYVFDGRASKPYLETDITNPLTEYGKSKLEGEQRLYTMMDRHVILRISWLYGANGVNFVKTIRSIAQKKASASEPLLVVNDQAGTPTYTLDVCRQTISVIQKGVYGLFHSTSEGFCTWYDFAKAIIKAYGIPVDLRPCTTDEFPRPAPRPAYSVLENSRLKHLGLNIMPGWEEGFRKFLKSEN